MITETKTLSAPKSKSPKVDTMKNYKVKYQLAGCLVKFAEFDTFKEVQAFKKVLAVADNCRFFKMVRAKYKVNLGTK